MRSSNSKLFKCAGSACATLPPLAVSLSMAFFTNPAAFAQASLQGKTVLLPPGTAFEGRIQKTIGSSISHEGERFTIVVATPVLGNGSDVIIPAGARVVGEIVEAIPADKVKHPKGFKPYGKLRVTITELETPDGMTYPLVGSLAPDEYFTRNGSRAKINQNVGNSVGYAGSQAGFNMVAPGKGGRNNRSGGVMASADVMKNPLYARQQQQQGQTGEEKIRSLVPKGHELFIYNGSPLSVMVNAPFKIGISHAPGADAAYQEARERSHSMGRRFERDEDDKPPAGSSQAAPAAPEAQDDSNGMGFLQQPLQGANTAPAAQSGPLTPPGVTAAPAGLVPGTQGTHSTPPPGVPQQQSTPGSTF